MNKTKQQQCQCRMRCSVVVLSPPSIKMRKWHQRWHISENVLLLLPQSQANGEPRNQTATLSDRSNRETKHRLRGKGDIRPETTITPPSLKNTVSISLKLISYPLCTHQVTVSECNISTTLCCHPVFRAHTECSAVTGTSTTKSNQHSMRLSYQDPCTQFSRINPSPH